MTWAFQLSTLLGLALACGGIAAWVYLPHEPILHALSALVSPILLAVSDERFRRGAEWLVEIGPKVLSRLRPSLSPVAIPATQETVTMFDFQSLISEAEAAAITAAKAAEEAAIKAALASLPSPYNAIFSTLVAVAEGQTKPVDALKSVGPVIAAELAAALATPAPEQVQP